MVESAAMLIAFPMQKQFAVQLFDVQHRAFKTALRCVVFPKECWSLSGMLVLGVGIYAVRL